MNFTRRGVGGLLAAVGSRSAAWATVPAVPNTTGMDREIEAALKRAADVGLLVQEARKAERPPAIKFQVADALRTALAAGNQAGFNIADRLGLLLSELNRDNRDGAIEFLEPARAWTHEELQTQYVKDFQSAVIMPSHAIELDQAAKRILSQDARRQYVEVEKVTKLPWYVIGALHYREASLNFMGHLHNGDFLKLRTVHDPANRPVGKWPPEPWDAEVAWRLSAIDALTDYTIDLRNQKFEEWTISWTLFTSEKYNGWGYRGRYDKAHHRSFMSPYLWSYTQLYEGGGFPKDRVWSDTYFSKQAGLVAIMKTLSKLAPDDVKFAMA